MSYTTPQHCIFCGDPMSLCSCPPEILEFARAHVVFTEDGRGIVSGDTLRILIERAQEWGRIKSTDTRLPEVAAFDLKELHKALEPFAMMALWSRDEWRKLDGSTWELGVHPDSVALIDDGKLTQGQLNALETIYEKIDKVLSAVSPLAGSRKEEQ